MWSGGRGAQGPGRGGTRRGATAAREAGMQASGVAVKEEPGTEFLSAKSFAGSRTGYVFKAGARGLGYYRDRAHTAYVGSEAHARDVARPAPAAAPPAAVKQEPRAEAQRLRVEIPPAGRAGASEGLRSAVAQTPGLLTGRGTARQSKKREKKSREDERATDLAVLRQHVSHVADLAASVMHRLDGKRRRFDARRVQGEGEDWLDWTLEERGRFPQLQEEARAQARSTLRWDPARGWVAGASGHGEGGAGGGGALGALDLAAARWAESADCIGAALETCEAPSGCGGGRVRTRSPPLLSRAATAAARAAVGRRRTHGGAGGGDAASSWVPSICDGRAVPNLRPWEHSERRGWREAVAATEGERTTAVPSAGLDETDLLDAGADGDPLMAMLQSSSQLSVAQTFGVGGEAEDDVDDLLMLASRRSASEWAEWGFDVGEGVGGARAAGAGAGGGGRAEGLPAFVPDGMVAGILQQTLIKMCATDALPNLRVRPGADAAGTASGGGGGTGDGVVFRAEMAQRVGTYGPDGKPAVHVVTVKILSVASGRMPIEVGIEPKVCLDTAALVRSLYPQGPDRRDECSYKGALKRVLRLVCMHLELLNSVWEEVRELRQDPRLRHAFCIRIASTLPHRGAFAVQVEFAVGGVGGVGGQGGQGGEGGERGPLKGPILWASLPWNYPGVAPLISLSALPLALKSSRTLKRVMAAMLARASTMPSCADASVADQVSAVHAEVAPSSSFIAASTWPDDTEMDWGTWGERWRGGWDDVGTMTADGDEVAAAEVAQDGAGGGGEAWFGLSLDEVAGDCRGVCVHVCLSVCVCVCVCVCISR